MRYAVLVARRRATTSQSRSEAHMQDRDASNGDSTARLHELRRENDELKRLATHLAEAAKRTGSEQMHWVYALEGNRDGVWDWNATTDEVFFSPRWKEMLGYSEDDISPRVSEWDSRIHPNDKEAVYHDLHAHLNGETPFYQSEHRLRCKDGSYRWVLDRGRVVSWTEDGRPLRIVGTHTDITARKTTEIENERLVGELTQALRDVRRLSGLLPICVSCKKIRDDRGYWNQIESYIAEHSEADFSHSICPDCAQKLYPGLATADLGDA